MKHVVSAIIIALIWSVPSPVLGDSPCEKSHVVKASEAAPCDGVLWPSKWSKDALRMKNVLLPTLQADLEKLKNTSASQLRLTKAELDIERRYSKLLESQLDEAIGATQDAWYKHPGLWVSVGLVVGAAVTVSLTYAVNR